MNPSTSNQVASPPWRKNLKLIRRTVRLDGKIEEVWQPAGQVHHLLYAVGFVLTLIAFWPLAILLLLGWAAAASHAHDKYYVIKDPAVESSGKEPRDGVQPIKKFG